MNEKSKKFLESREYFLRLANKYFAGEYHNADNAVDEYRQLIMAARMAFQQYLLELPAAEIKQR